ncbi:MAG TPA: hypothetical protein PLP50_08680 [Thermoanaerobaculia bacterium]|nr:hypothetical protein [Thermoanaerobaculia bacterium]HQN08728.1 hypothetical protein [Thermoanaerobaculia bacterium]
MKATTTRPATPEERLRLEAYLHPKPKSNPAWAATVMVTVPLAWALFMILNMLLGGLVPAAVRLLLAVAIAGGGAWHFGKRLSAQHAESARPAEPVLGFLQRDLESGRVVVNRWEADAFVKVASDPGRFVSTTWFAKLTDGTVVLLAQPDLEEAELSGDFPATSFEIATGEESRHVLSIRRTGERLEPVALRAPLSDAEWEELGDEADAPVPFGWEEVLARAAANPLRARGKGEARSRQEALEREILKAHEEEAGRATPDTTRPT